MEWYGPLTVLPAIALLVLSTSNFIVSLNNEIFELGKIKDEKREIIQLKLAQLKRLGIANSCLYASALLFLIAGISKAITMLEAPFYYIMLLGVIFTAIALTFLFIHSIKATQIRHKNLQL